MAAHLTSLQNLPVEALGQTLSYLPPKEIILISAVSTFLRDTIRDGSNDTLIFARQAAQVPAKLTAQVELLTAPPTVRTSFLDELGRFLAHRGIIANATERYFGVDEFVGWYRARQQALADARILDAARLVPEAKRRRLQTLVNVILDIHLFHHAPNARRAHIDDELMSVEVWARDVAVRDMWRYLQRGDDKDVHALHKQVVEIGIRSPVSGEQPRITANATPKWPLTPGLPHDAPENGNDADDSGPPGYVSVERLSGILGVRLPAVGDGLSYAVKTKQANLNVTVGMIAARRLTCRERALVLDQLYLH
jgi:hypothetical protein